MRWHRTTPRAGDVQVYRACEQLSEPLIYLMLLFSPWALGTTEAWSIWGMNMGGYALGLLLLTKLAIRLVSNYRPARWDWPASVEHPPSQSPRATRGDQPFSFPTASLLTRALVVLTVLLLLHCLVSALNARATFDEGSLLFVYHDCIEWLPHSLDSGATWFAFWMYLGLAFSFWAIWDWLLGKSSGEQRAEWLKQEGGFQQARPLFPTRMRRLLWVLALNGGLLGLEAIIQRAADSPRLLFLVLPRIHQTAEGQFGPYAYRSNAAQYFNLLWPVCLGFWWTLNRGAGTRERRQHILLVAAGIMAACPIISTSRGGALISITIAVLAAAVFTASHLLFSSPRGQTAQKLRVTARALTVFFLAAMALGFALGWKELSPRLSELDDGFAGREEMYRAARPIAEDYPMFGTGPGSFETVSQLYPRPDIFWPSQLHNDWLETRITFGWVGCALLALALLCVLLRWTARGGIHGGRRFVILTWLALAGCLLHARFDFPFQIHSTLFSFLLLCAILFTLTRSPSRVAVEGR